MDQDFGTGTEGGSRQAWAGGEAGQGQGQGWGFGVGLGSLSLLTPSLWSCLFPSFSKSFLVSITYKHMLLRLR